MDAGNLPSGNPKGKPDHTADGPILPPLKIDVPEPRHRPARMPGKMSGAKPPFL